MVSEYGKAEASEYRCTRFAKRPTWRVVVRYGRAAFALQLALQKGKHAASVRHGCKASVDAEEWGLLADVR